MKQQKLTAEDYLESLDGIRQAEAPPHFYAKLRARMEKSNPAGGWQLPFRPAWIVGTLALLLVLNSMMILGHKSVSPQSGQQETDIREFMNTYNQILPSSY